MHMRLEETRPKPYPPSNRHGPPKFSGCRAVRRLEPCGVGPQAAFQPRSRNNVPFIVDVLEADFLHIRVYILLFWGGRYEMRVTTAWGLLGYDSWPLQSVRQVAGVSHRCPWVSGSANSEP